MSASARQTPTRYTQKCLKWVDVWVSVKCIWMLNVCKTNPNTVYTEVSEMGGCLSFCKMYWMLNVCKTNPNMVYTEVSEMGWCLSICSMYLDAHYVCKTNPNTVYTEVFEMGWCLSFCKMYLGAHPVRKTNPNMVCKEVSWEDWWRDVVAVCSLEGMLTCQTPQLYSQHCRQLGCSAHVE